MELTFIQEEKAQVLFNLGLMADTEYIRQVFTDKILDGAVKELGNTLIYLQENTIDGVDIDAVRYGIEEVAVFMFALDPEKLPLPFCIRTRSPE